MNRDSKGRFCKAESDRNYRLRKDLTKIVDGRTLYRIEATRDIAQFGVTKGELGGWIESYENLSGDAWVSGKAHVSGNAHVAGNAWVSYNAWVSGYARVYGNARVAGDAVVYGDARVYGYARVYGDAMVYGDVLKYENDCINIIGGKYNITILPNSIQIGCRYYTKAEWFCFPDREILAMDGKDGLRW